jgi:hypothetical protein
VNVAFEIDVSVETVLDPNDVRPERAAWMRVLGGSTFSESKRMMFEEEDLFGFVFLLSGHDLGRAVN